MGLNRRLCSIDVICTRCKSGEENDIHALLRCSWSAVVWVKARLEDMVEGSHFLCFADWFNWVLKAMSQESVELVCIILWNIWFERNHVRLGGEHRRPERVVAIANGLLNAYHLAKLELKHDGMGGCSVTKRSGSLPQWGGLS